MLPLRFPVAVILQRTKLTNPWADARWEPLEIVADDGSLAKAQKLAEDAHGTRWCFGGHYFELHSSEAEGYFLNITTPDPKVFIMWRLAEEGVQPGAFPVVITVSYNQAARMLDGGEQVDAVPMPREVFVAVQSFVGEHYKPEPKRKARRNDPFREREEHGS